jgi:hypothetical protein
MTLTSHLMSIFGAIHILVNFALLAQDDLKTAFKFYDDSGKLNSINWEPSFVNYYALVHLINCGVVLMVQGRKALSVFKPLVTEYEEAEAG